MLDRQQSDPHRRKHAFLHAAGLVSAVSTLARRKFRPLKARLDFPLDHAPAASALNGSGGGGSDRGGGSHGVRAFHRQARKQAALTIGVPPSAAMGGDGSFSPSTARSPTRSDGQRAVTVSSRSIAAPAGAWKATVDPSSGRTYYYNEGTRKTQWTMPHDFHPDVILTRLAGPANPATDPVFADAAKNKMQLWEQRIAAETNHNSERKFSEPVFADHGAGHHHVLVGDAGGVSSSVHSHHGVFHDPVLDNLGLGHHTQHSHNQGIGPTYMQRLALWEDHHESELKAQDEAKAAHRPVPHAKLTVLPGKIFIAG